MTLRNLYAISLVFVLSAFTTLAGALNAPEGDAPAAGCETRSSMNNQKLEKLIRAIDARAQGRPGYWKFTVREREVLVITDERADRMRILSGVVRAGELGQEALYRITQSNFDTALDARYAIAKGVVWSAYLHPLSSLTGDQFLSGVGQVVNLAASYGTSYSSGGLTFGGGDSNELIQELLDKARSI